MAQPFPVSPAVTQTEINADMVMLQPTELRGYHRSLVLWARRDIWRHFGPLSFLTQTEGAGALVRADDFVFLPVISSAQNFCAYVKFWFLIIQVFYLLKSE